MSAARLMVSGPSVHTGSRQVLPSLPMTEAKSIQSLLNTYCVALEDLVATYEEGVADSLLPNAPASVDPVDDTSKDDADKTEEELEQEQVPAFNA